jgi:hypothetical protein
MISRISTMFFEFPQASLPARPDRRPTAAEGITFSIQASKMERALILPMGEFQLVLAHRAGAPCPHFVSR